MLKVKAADGVWQVDLGNPRQTERSGFTGDSAKVGDPIVVLAPFLTRAAAIGLALALITGLWLFSVKPEEYFANHAFRWKAVLIAGRWIGFL